VYPSLQDSKNTKRLKSPQKQGEIEKGGEGGGVEESDPRGKTEQMAQREWVVRGKEMGWDLAWCEHTEEWGGMRQTRERSAGEKVTCQ